MWGSASTTHLCTPWTTKGVFGYLGWECLKCMMPEKIVWVVGWRPKQPQLCTPWARKGVFGYLGYGFLKRTMLKRFVWVVGWRTKHPYLCTLQASKGVFEYLGWGCLKCTMPQKKFLFFRSGVTNTPRGGVGNCAQGIPFRSQCTLGTYPSYPRYLPLLP